MNFSTGFTVFSFAFLTSLAIAAALRAWAPARLLNIPNERSSHDKPIPRGGGLAIAFTTLTGVFLAATHSGLHLGTLLGYAAPAFVVTLISWIDDLYSLSSRNRFFWHLVVALAAIISFGSLHTVILPGATVLGLGWLALPMNLLWIVGVTNSYNFMDGADGIAGIQSIVAASVWALIAWRLEIPMLLIMSLLLGGSALGFLVHNWPPARIFMGDVGSIFLGFTFGVFPLMAASVHTEPALMSAWPILGFLPIWPFVMDAAFTFLRRLVLRQNAFVPHRTHVYQRFIIAGWKHLHVSLLYGILAALGGVLAWHVAIQAPYALELSLPVIVSMFWGLLGYLRRVESKHAHPKNRS